MISKGAYVILKVYLSPSEDDHFDHAADVLIDHIKDLKTVNDEPMIEEVDDLGGVG